MQPLPERHWFARWKGTVCPCTTRPRQPDVRTVRWSLDRIRVGRGPNWWSSSLSGPDRAIAQGTSVTGDDDTWRPPGTWSTASLPAVGRRGSMPCRLAGCNGEASGNHDGSGGPEGFSHLARGSRLQTCLPGHCPVRSGRSRRYSRVGRKKMRSSGAPVVGLASIGFCHVPTSPSIPGVLQLQGGSRSERWPSEPHQLATSATCR